MNCIAPTWATTTSGAREFCYIAFERFFKNDYQNLGKALKQIKSDFVAEYSYDSWMSKSVVLYGDPSAQLPVYRYVNSNITQNTQWSGSIVVEDNIIISEGATLTIMPGTGVFIANGKHIVVEGKILANGTSAYPIRFQSISGHYSKILLMGDSNQFTYCVFDGGSYNMYVKSCFNIFSHCTFKNASYCPFYTYMETSGWSSFTLDYCLFNNNCGGVEANFCYGKITNTTITGSSGDGLSLYNAIIGCASSYYISKGGGLFINNNISGNGSRGIHLNYNGVLYLGYYTTPGHNKITGNSSHEIILDNYANDRLYQSNTGGYSDIYDSNLGYYIYNLAKTFNGEYYISWTVPAENNYWNTPSGPSGGDERFYGPVDWNPFKTTPQASGAGYGGQAPLSLKPGKIAKAKSVISAGTISNICLASRGSDDSIQNTIDLKIQILELRNQIATNADDYGNCRRLVSLYSLTRDLDPEDQTGERQNILGLVSQKRDDLTNVDKKGKIGEANKLLGEVAMVLEIDWLLNHEQQYDQAQELIEKYDPLIENSDNRRELLYHKLNLFETTNRYPEALAVVEELKEEVKKTKNSIADYEPPSFKRIEQRLLKESKLDSIALLLSKKTKPAEPQEIVDLPKKFALRANYPNPFNPTTTIPFDLPEVSRVKIQVFDLAGREVAVLANGSYPAGSHQVIFDGNGLPSGMYFIRAQMKPEDQEKDAHHFTEKMMLLK